MALESLWESACLEYAEQVRRLQEAPCLQGVPFYSDLFFLPTRPLADFFDCLIDLLVNDFDLLLLANSNTIMVSHIKR